MSPLDELTNEVMALAGPSQRERGLSGFILILRRPDVADQDLEEHEIIADDGTPEQEVANILRGMAELVEVDGLRYESGRAVN